jgi:S1-C subfamily serine protease
MQVHVLGFPVGGDEVSITEGVVSRVEVQSYSHSHSRALAVTVDAAVNSGNSGGPVVSCLTGKLIGIAFQGYAGSSVENQGHMVPIPFVHHFLEGVHRGNPKLPSLGMYEPHPAGGAVSAPHRR